MFIDFNLNDDFSFAASYYCRGIKSSRLYPRHTAAIFALQGRVMAALSPAEQCFLIPKNLTELSTNTVPPNYVTGLVNSADRLVGVGFLRLISTSSATFLTPTASTSQLNDHLDQLPYGHAAVIGTVMVDPDHRQRGLMSRMLSDLLGAAHQRDVKALYSEVATLNQASAKGFLHHGFQCVAEGDDPVDGTPLQFYHLNLSNRRPAHGIAPTL